MPSNPKSSAPLATPQALALIGSVKDYAIFALDVEGTVLTWNEGARLIKGWSDQEIIGQSFSRFYPQDDVEARKPWRFLEAAVASGRAEDEGWRVRKDGTRFWADAVLTALYDDHGEPRGFLKVTRDLSERREAEERLRRGEQRLRVLIESVKDYAIFMLDPTGKIETWNSGAEHIKGWRADEIIGRDISIFYPEDNRARAGELLRIAAESGTVEDEGWRVRKDGSRFWADVVISRVDDEAGRLIGFSKVTRDLTLRRSAEQALRESEERTRLMIESVGDYAIFMLDPHGFVTSWNSGASRLHGYSADEVTGTHFGIFYTSDDRAVGAADQALEAADTHGRFEHSGWRVRRDGTRFWANVVLSALRDPSGRLSGFVKITRDETDRRRSEQRLATRARQQAATAALGLAVLRERDPRTVAERAVRAVRDVMGAELVALLTLGANEFTLVAGFGWEKGAIGAAIPFEPLTVAGRAVLSRDVVVVDDFGSSAVRATDLERTHGSQCGLGVAIPSANPADRPVGVILAYRTRPRELAGDDASFLQGVANVVAASFARQRDEEQIHVLELAAANDRSRTEQAEQKVRSRDEFISIASHELRTPLNALQLNLHSLERAVETGDPERTKARIGGALGQSKHLTQLIERLLDVSRMVTGELHVVREPLNLASLVREAIEALRETAGRSGSEILFSEHGNSDGSWDRIRLQQLAVNLLSNALKYGEGKPIDVRVDGDSSTVRLSVADHGIGIEPGDTERIFERFERAVSTRNFAGLGLGLYISRQIVRAHGGEVRVESEPGRGSMFVVELPRAGSSEEPLARRDRR